jgi:hypothetical protein
MRDSQREQSQQTVETGNTDELRCTIAVMLMSKYIFLSAYRVI